ncbi:MAG: clostripain-related cysteine peptidase [Candidatus Ornithomonoglobus sp.]
MKKFTIFSTMLLILSFLCGCGGGVVVQKEAKRMPSTGTSWTVMMYMCGSTLEEEYESGSRVLESLAYDLPENINVVVETGGSRLWHTDDVDCDYQQDYVVQKNGIRLVNQKPAANMGESETLKEFLSWGMKTYPAEHYIAVIWDHGAGPLGGVAFDSAHDYDSLSLEELKSVLSGLDEKLDLVGFDASLMSNIETASALSLYADYMVGSEDVIPISGWDYNGLFDFLSNYPQASVPEVGQVICDGVMAKVSEEERDLVSMAVSDLSKETTLSLHFEGLGGMLDSSVDDLYRLRDVVEAMNSLEHMGGNSPWEGYSNIIDLGNLVDSLSDSMGDISANIKAIMDEMIVYKCMSEYHSASSGLGLYYPSHRDGEALSRYKEICVSNSYMSFIEKTCINMDIANRTYTPENGAIWYYYNNLAYENVMTASPDMNGHYVLTATHPELFTRTGVNFYIYSANDASYLYLYSDYETRYDSSVNGFVYDFSGRLPTLNSTPVSMYLVSRNVCYDIYSIPVVYNGEIANIRVRKSKLADSFGEYTIIGIWKGVDIYSGMAQREYKKLNTGDVIIPIYRVYGQDETSYVEGSKIRIGFGGVKITEKLIGDGDYIVSYTAEDIYGESYECATNNLVATKGNIKIMDY